MSESTIRRFLFENLNIRGALVHLGDVWQQMQVDRNYQPTVAGVGAERSPARALVRDPLANDDLVAVAPRRGLGRGRDG